ncbi:unnamed protein product [Miscanthus lutarioriparius]|uniref:Uncharacterized protein n=1 Tax=Miscanthus lutarioriparius TaxID=422564 RepID=A0A811SCC8_9POAL|nr:unnamed protein product [Miscanthus lutarioriparius]
MMLPSPTPTVAAAPPRPALPSQQQAAPLEREVANTHTPHAQRPASLSPTPGGGLRHRRPWSNEATAAVFQGLEPLRVPDSDNRAHLKTILSGKDGLVVAAP